MTASPATTARPTPHIDILFLGSPGIGKATFLACLPSIVHPSVARRENAVTLNQDRKNPGSKSTSSPSTSTSTTATTTISPSNSIPQPLTGPLSFSVSLYARPYTITIHPSTSHLFVDAFPTHPPPRLAVIAFSVSDRASLFNARHYWLPQLREKYRDGDGDGEFEEGGCGGAEEMRVLVLGLKRDERTGRRVRRKDVGGGESRSGGGGLGLQDFVGLRLHGEQAGNIADGNANANADGDGDGDEDGEWEYECVMPEEGLQAARHMGADRYAECSALTGELMYEVVEDLTKMAAKSTVEDGRQDSGSCAVM